MFQSYKYKKYIGHKDGKHSWEYELTDSEFGIILGEAISMADGWIAIEVGIAVIQEYSKRKLNVGKNLMAAFIWYNKRFPSISIQQVIDINKRNNLLFLQYEEDLQKYLLLL